MKHIKRLAALLLTAALLCMTCVPVWADEPDDSGMYNISSTLISAIKSAGGTAVDKIQADDYGDYYPDAARFSVTCPGVESGKEYVVFVVKGTEKPNSSNIVYINQQTAGSGGALVFENVFPSSLEEGSYSVYVTGAGQSADTTLATFFYHMVQQVMLKLQLMGVDTTGVEVTLLRKGAEVDAASQIDGSVITFPAVSGSEQFEVRVTKPGYVSFRNVLALTENKTINVPLVAPGDLNGAMENGSNRQVGVTDMQALFEYLSTSASNSTVFLNNPDYFAQVADINGDTEVNILDYQALYLRITAPAA